MKFLCPNCKAKYQIADEKITAALGGASPKKVIVVPGRMINIVV